MSLSGYEPTSVATERIAWLRACYWALRRRLETSPVLASWRRRTPRPLEIEALLMVVDPTVERFQMVEVAARLGLSSDQARALCGRARRLGVLVEEDRGWCLSRRGRQLLGELEAAQAEALRSVGRQSDVGALARLWASIQDEAEPEANRRVQDGGHHRSVDP